MAAVHPAWTMRAHPDHLSGHGAPTATLVCTAGGRVLQKSCTKGVTLAMVPGTGLGVTVNLADDADACSSGVGTATRLGASWMG
ncbi:asparaginase [Paracraurococcus lichenis]|uniref:Asparaginase n=1 Tax=Paracraurococcus lichenis TaxID=3064888 RepID=A0ABT9E961_9PROT|nr:asparaginase [Paracraurococcus sp. LOR1-02]MDO9712742.1 asparaginase [Paracraurococcus sp. LOR1-02]